MVSLSIFLSLYLLLLAGSPSSSSSSSSSSHLVVRKYGKILVQSPPSPLLQSQFQSLDNIALVSLSPVLSMQELALAEQMIASDVRKIFISSTVGSDLNQGLLCNDNNEGEEEGGGGNIEEYQSFTRSKNSAREGTILRVSFNAGDSNNSNKDRDEGKEGKEKSMEEGEEEEDLRVHYNSFRQIRAQLSSVLALAVDFESSRSAPFVVLGGETSSSTSSSSSSFTSIAQYFNIDSCIVCTDSLESWLHLFGRKIETRTIRDILDSPFRQMQLSLELIKERVDRGSDDGLSATYSLRVVSEISHLKSAAAFKVSSASQRYLDSHKNGNRANSSSSSSSLHESTWSKSGLDDVISDSIGRSVTFARQAVDSRRHSLFARALVSNPSRKGVRISIIEPLPFHYDIYLHSLRYRFVGCMPLEGGQIDNNSIKNNNDSNNSNNSNNISNKSARSIPIHGAHHHVASLPSFRSRRPSRPSPSTMHPPFGLNFGSVSWKTTLPPGCSLQYEFRAQRSIMHRDLYAPDSARGEDILPAMLLVNRLVDEGGDDDADDDGDDDNEDASEVGLYSSNSNCDDEGKEGDFISGNMSCRNQDNPKFNRSHIYERVIISSSGLSLAVFPDFTMLFNVILLISTVLVFFTGNMVNVLISDAIFVKPLNSIEDE